LILIKFCKQPFRPFTLSKRFFSLTAKPSLSNPITHLDDSKPVATVQSLTTKEIKELCRPRFTAEPEKYYPTKVFEKINYHRARCPKCGTYYWRHSHKADTCGDSKCIGSYKFIDKATRQGLPTKKITYTDAWQGFEKSLTSARIPSTSINRYPVVARWRDDVDFVAAGIYCFQPYCVTGEIDPPANPLICPQFCVRFNDLDNIGLTGRHYSGFIMLGIQVFNYPDKHVFFKEECVEFNHRWLTEELKIDPDEITYVEDVWAGGGNCGPSMEYFVKGLEVGNMVFMQYKTSPDGHLEELPIKIIDVGIGLERIPWLINGSATSYIDVFNSAFQWLTSTLDVSVNSEIWEKYGQLSCKLNIDEVSDVEEVWKEIAQEAGVEVPVLKEAINQAKELYVLLDHTRTLMMTIQDGCLPSNVGGGFNVRNMLRRVFAILTRNGWWEKIDLDGLMILFDKHKQDLKGIVGEFAEFKSFKDIVAIEYDRWLNTFTTQKDKLDKLMKKKNGLSLDDWITAMTAWGIPADIISEVTKQPIPGNLYYELAQREERRAKAATLFLYDTTHLPETENLYYVDHKTSKFEAKVIDVFANLEANKINNILILDKSAFYPISGGQATDTGDLIIDGENYRVVNCEKIGKSVLHFLDKPLPKPDISHYKGMTVTGVIDQERRDQLRRHHTATHIVFAACRRVLGPHVWQAGAKKTEEQAHLDITHFSSLNHEEETRIENEANRIILGAKKIDKSFVDKAEAELKYGFGLYQGGVVPGSQLRIVNIDETDVEACCGTHCDNTSEVGWIRIAKSTRISDGIVRLYFVAGEKTIERLNMETGILDELCDLWSVSEGQIMDTAKRFFKEYKRLNNETDKQNKKILDLQIKFILDNDRYKSSVVLSDQDNPTIYFSQMGIYFPDFQAKEKDLVIVGNTFLYGILFNKENLDLTQLKEELMKVNPQANIKIAAKGGSNKKGGKGGVDVVQFSYTGNVNVEKTLKYLQEKGFGFVTI